MNNLKITDVRIHPGDSAFLLDDGSTAILYDTGFGFTGEALAEKVAEKLGSRPLDYLFLSHSHYDHVLGSCAVLRKFPDAKVIAGSYTADVFRREGALRKMRELDEKFAARCGITDYTASTDNLRVDITVNDGEEIHAGTQNFRVLELPGHTKCSIGFYHEAQKILIASETLGVYDGTDTIVPTFLVGVHDTLNSIDKVLDLKIDRILIPHNGLISREATEFFLANMKPRAIEAANFFAIRIKKGLSTEQIVEDFKQTYRKKYVAEAYPEDAVNLNASLMTELVRREFAL
ncbi:MAG: MBL fold metallo-hydrolase [Christensenellaceae bacterium]|nr:MBL fold metallo-hydrolase [Christensenellaceae bacterium]